MSSPETPADLARIIELDRAVRDADAAIDAAKNVVGELQQREGKLDTRRRDLNAVRPADTADLADGMVDALAADPSASPDPEAMARAIELQAATRTKFDEWQVSVNLTEQAIAKVGRDIQRAEAVVEEKIVDRKAAWSTFTFETQAYLVDAFRTAFVQLRTDIIEPLIAFSDIAVVAGAMKLDRDSSIILRHFSNNPRPPERLLKEQAGRSMGPGECLSFIERFRASLPSDLSAKAKRKGA